MLQTVAQGNFSAALTELILIIEKSTETFFPDDLWCRLYCGAQNPLQWSLHLKSILTG